MCNYQYETLVMSYINQCSNNSINSHDKRACNHAQNGHVIQFSENSALEDGHRWS